MVAFPKVASFKTPAAFRSHLRQLDIEFDLDETVLSAPDSPLAQPMTLPEVIGGKTVIGNRFCILPMEGWDGTEDGKPSALTLRRWRRFGDSGAKLIWGGEAVAVRHDGRANPNQLVINAENRPHIQNLREQLVQAHIASSGSADGLVVGLQLTHSGRYARPNSKTKAEPMILYHHPLLDRKLNLPTDYPLLTDMQIEGIIADTVRAAVLAESIGFDFVDIKHCHGYLGHEFLSARDRGGAYGGSFEHRTRYLREIVQGIRRDAPRLGVAVRLSAFDMRPFHKGQDGTGEIDDFAGAYDYAFGLDASDKLVTDLSETVAFLALLRNLNVRLVCITAGSPYYNPHIQRPATFPPSDGYQPPEDPLCGVARQIQATALLKHMFPDLVVVGSAYSYLQDYLPHVAQYQVREGNVDLVGLGRMVLAYPTMPIDILNGCGINRKQLCRTFSDCTTAPRNGMVSGCYPLDPDYKSRPESEQLKLLKKT